MERNNLHKLSWNTQTFNPPDYREGLNLLIEKLKSRNIPFTLKKDPRGFTKREVIFITYNNIKFFVSLDDEDYRLYKQAWKNVDYYWIDGLDNLIETLLEESNKEY